MILWLAFTPSVLARTRGCAAPPDAVPAIGTRQTQSESGTESAQSADAFRGLL